MTKHVPLLPRSNLRLWRQPLITLAWFLLAMVPAFLGANLLVALYQHHVVSRDFMLIGGGVIIGFIVCAGLFAALKVIQQDKAAREQPVQQKSATSGTAGGFPVD
jgi:hypothetical protein